ncbi:MAG: O-methyltransferase [Solirubrobacteraceae bacterium]|nr:O-methyltransferase [Solirubrobacteraceae bacterium]
MSPDLVSDAVETYVLAHATPFPEPLRALEARVRAELPNSVMLSGPVEGRLLQALIHLARPKLVLELGTYSGYSALVMAQALPPGGRVITCELDEERAAFAAEQFAAIDGGDLIELRLGPALDTIATIDEPIDLVFIDADKGGYIDYYDAVVPKLSPRGLIVADNTLWSGRVAGELAPDDDSGRAIAAFNAHVYADPRTVCVPLTVRDGVTLIWRV